MNAMVAQGNRLVISTGLIQRAEAAENSPVCWRTRSATSPPAISACCRADARGDAAPRRGAAAGRPCRRHHPFGRCRAGRGDGRPGDGDGGAVRLHPRAGTGGRSGGDHLPDARGMAGGRAGVPPATHVGAGSARQIGAIRTSAPIPCRATGWSSCASSAPPGGEAGDHAGRAGGRLPHGAGQAGGLPGTAGGLHRRHPADSPRRGGATRALSPNIARGGRRRA